MKKFFSLLTIALTAALASILLSNQQKSEPFVVGKPDIKAMSSLTFSPEGMLFVGDSRSSQLFAIDLTQEGKATEEVSFRIPDVDQKLAAMLGCKPSDVMIHDLAVHPQSKDAYIAVSNGGADWSWDFHLPNDLRDAQLLFKVDAEGKISEVSLDEIRYSKVGIANPVPEDIEHRWKKGAKLRVDVVSDMFFDAGKLYVAGLSNEEFVSTMRVYDFPFTENNKATELEIYHGAHGAWETKSPVRSFVPFEMNGEKHLLAAYLCTPLVTIPAEKLEDGAHIKGKTIAELGYGNYPLDMVALEKDGKTKVLIANSNRNMMQLDIEDIEGTEEISEYAPMGSGVKHQTLPGGSLYQMAKQDAGHALIMRRSPNGQLKMETIGAR
jgi:hypothetical protein